MISLTIDASVYINALNPWERGSETSRLFLETVFKKGTEVRVFSPTLLVVEVAASIARIIDDEEKSQEAAFAIRMLPRQVFVPLTDPVAVNAAALGAKYRLKDVDAVYAAVALQHGAVLVSLDKQQLDRLSEAIVAITPADAIELMKK